jgi:hypothetical protein
VTSSGTPTDPVTRVVATVAQPLPADIASLWGKAAGSRQLGSALTL